MQQVATKLATNTSIGIRYQKDSCMQRMFTM